MNRNHRWLVGILALFAFSGMGCESEPTTAEPTSGPNGPLGKYDGGWVESEEGELVPDVAGSYHVVLDSLVQTRDLETGKEETAISEAHVLAHVSQQGAQLFLELDFCDLILAEIGGKKPYFKSEMVRALDSAQLGGRVLWNGSEWVAEVDRGVWVVGADLTDPLNEALPIDGEDPRVVDVDADGEPGVAMYIQGYPFRIFVGLRAEIAFEAALFTDGRVWQGDATLVVDTAVYGDTIPFVNAANELEEGLAATEILSQSDVVTFLQLNEGVPLTCANMVEQSNFLTDGLEGQPPVGAPPETGTIEEFLGEEVEEAMAEHPEDDGSPPEASDEQDSAR